MSICLCQGLRFLNVPGFLRWGYKLTAARGGGSWNVSNTSLRLHGMHVTCVYLETLWEGELSKSSDFPGSNCRILMSFESIALLEIADL